jgi:hypothetical protein
MLAAFEAALDAKGIDIVPGLARNLDSQQQDRPRLAKLGGFPVPKAKGASSAPEDWMSEFASGAFEYLAAFRPASGSTASVGELADSDRFMTEWSKAEESQRVFVAFTREDAATAQEVAQVLRAQGLVVFTYLRDKGAAPWAKPEIVGRLFREAGHHFVIDTMQARRSGGVAFEALALARLKKVTKEAVPARPGKCVDLFRAFSSGN